MVYFVQGEQTGLIKIGKSVDFRCRLSNLQSGSAEQLMCVGAIENARDDAPYHARFRDDRVHGEWFRSSEKLMAFIQSLPKTKYAGLVAKMERYESKPPVDTINGKPMTSKQLASLAQTFSDTFGAVTYADANLTAKQEVCVSTYIETRDAEAAILSAYDCDAATAQRMKYDIFTRPAVLNTLIFLLGKDEPGVQKFIKHAKKNESARLSGVGSEKFQHQHLAIA